jgi:hypothetical protein
MQRVWFRHEAVHRTIISETGTVDYLVCILSIVYATVIFPIKVPRKLSLLSSKESR